MKKLNDYSVKSYFNFSPEQCSEVSMYKMLGRLGQDTPVLLMLSFVPWPECKFLFHCFYYRNLMGNSLILDQAGVML